jgi:hypothetical protein
MADAAAKATADGEREVTRILMALDPKSTLAAMAAIRDHAFMERWGAFVRRFQLARMNTNHLMTAVHVHSAVDAVHRTLRAVVTSSQHLTMLVRRLLQSTRAVQRFVRHRLADLRRRKARLVTMWKDAEADARQRIRGAIDALRDRGRGNVASQRFGDALWGLYMDCWGQPDTIAAAVERLWWERRAEYVTRFRRWRLAEVSARRQKMPREGEVSRRIAEGKLGQNFQPLLFSPKSVDLDEIAYQIVLVQLGRPNPRPRLREAYRRGTSEPPSPLVVAAVAATAGAATGNANHSTVTFADADGESSATPDVPRDPPVSYYHALIRFDAQKPHLAMFLKRLCAGEAITYAESAAKAVQKQLTSARIIHARWAGGKLVATLDMSASKKVIDEDGSPKSRYAAALGDIPLSPRRSPRPGSPEGGSMELSASPPPVLTLLASPRSPRSMIGSPKAPQPPTVFSPRSTFTSPRAAAAAKPVRPRPPMSVGAVERDALRREEEECERAWQAQRSKLHQPNAEASKSRLVQLESSRAKLASAAERRHRRDIFHEQVDVSPAPSAPAPLTPRTRPNSANPRSRAASMILGGRGGAFIRTLRPPTGPARVAAESSLSARRVIADELVRWSSTQ